MAGNVASHERELRRLLGDTSDFVVEDVRYSLTELEAFATQVRQEHGWFGQIGAELVAADPGLDMVRVRFRAPHEGVAIAISDHFDDPEWLELEWEGPMSWDGPRGGMAVTVIDAKGRPVEGAQCEWHPVDPTVDADTALAFSTDATGTCRNDYLPAVAYEVRVYRFVEGQGRTLIGTGAGTVPADGLGAATVQIP
jgi:hypothetical protein